MKNLKRLGAALVLTFALALSAFAGDIPTPPDPEPTPAASASGQTGDTNPGAVSTSPSANSVSAFTEVTVDLLESVLLLW
jgi:hypothetical protein